MQEREREKRGRKKRRAKVRGREGKWEGEKIGREEKERKGKR